MCRDVPAMKSPIVPARRLLLTWGRFGAPTSRQRLRLNHFLRGTLRINDLPVRTPEIELGNSPVPQR